MAVDVTRPFFRMLHQNMPAVGQGGPGGFFLAFQVSRQAIRASRVQQMAGFKMVRELRVFQAFVRIHQKKGDFFGKVKIPAEFLPFPKRGRSGPGICRQNEHFIGRDAVDAPVGRSKGEHLAQPGLPYEFLIQFPHLASRVGPAKG